MVNRAFENSELKKIVEQLKIMRQSDEYVARSFESFLNEPPHPIYHLGQYLSFATVLSALYVFNGAKQKAKELLLSISNGIGNPDNFIVQINSEILKKLDNEKKL
jgi:hypothetical protein